MTYEEFLNSKTKQIKIAGFDISESDLNSNLFDFQKSIVKRALNLGRFAIFADCGLGKTLMQLEWAYQVSRYTQKPVLILAPLAVRLQTLNEAEKFGIDVSGIEVWNYEQLGNIDCNKYSGVVLDESSILKNFTGKTKQQLQNSFEETPYKLCCTATPAPNDPMEIGTHSEFLNVKKRNEMLSMYFVHDGGNTSKWRLKGHAEKSFYAWVSRWAVMVEKPSDLGFCATGYDLPKLNISEVEVKTESRNNGKLFNDIAISATNFNSELRATMHKRCNRAAEIANSDSQQYIVWCKLNDESTLLKGLIPDAIEVKGSDSTETKEERLLGFASGKYRVLVTKTKIAQFGLNFQNCNNQVFASFDFSFESLYQAIRRSYRFGQKKQVNITLITTDTMQNVSESINRKEKEFAKMKQEMNKQINDKTASFSNLSEFNDVSEGDFQMLQGDCVQRIKSIADESVGLSVFSPPFAELYTYSDYAEDMGNSKDYGEFMIQFGFLVKELHRVTMQGRNVAVHCMDLPIQKGKEGFIGLRDFSGLIIEAFTKAGFVYHSRITIWKDPVVEMQRTKALGLLHKQIKKDSTMSRVGIPDYVLIFRKDGERENPVKCDIPVDVWQKYASPVWMDINYSDTLQYTTARDGKDEKHICPLQLPTIERLIHLYSNKGDSILDPFSGIGSTPYQALKMNRKAIGIELKPSYFDVAVKNCREAMSLRNQLVLF